MAVNNIALLDAIHFLCLFIKKQREWVSQCKTQRRDVAIRYKTLDIQFK